MLKSLLRYQGVYNRAPFRYAATKRVVVLRVLARLTVEILERERVNVFQTRNCFDEECENGPEL